MVYHFIRFVVGLAVRVRYRLKITGKENIPEGGVIIAMNHQDAWDPLLVGTNTPRKLHIMAKESLFKNKLLAWTITEMGAFPINREKADIKSLKNSLKIIKDGKIFSLFIEGSRSKSGEMSEPKKGVGFIVAKSGAPVIPTYIYGTTNKKWFQAAGVVFGEPIYFGDETDYEKIANTIANAIKDLKNKVL
ncbi:lysophospholipid acyltransferase family protein [Anaerobacillus isosaccharinicus]|uniref:1-acyl-sn-glycerol-3-phosphate acyltransferase n=1 Tax=Anaerobacillus isosaccharinicus TaxID=1532552 RepID=A0A1S2LFA4_9BACI|nr:lysophospholipid acyltransferase family protein [Anaerobacillus isosaccharinicus]MBA5586273.1 1-acyl-sn-glycerol-3-phosphate acyltransferase [Anaerobacillus isosaccharinicus]QOY35475.1 1-acyl-sn-glycerol-3-phosphate acyltransferase [Anaerobacillus isosaccharinicus]